MNKNMLYGLCLGLFLGSCEYFKKQETVENAVARINTNYLYKSDIAAILPKEYTLEDSVKIATSYTNNWALKALLMQKAQENLSDEQVQNYENLVEQYKINLYTQSYLDMLTTQNTDTVISQTEKEQAFETYKNALILTEDLVKLRYIELQTTSQNKQVLAQRLKKFTTDDKKELLLESVHFLSSNLNDSIWLKSVEVLEQLPFLKGKLEQKDKFFELKENQSTYWVYVTDVRKKGDIPPLTYATPTLRQIILNKRKKEYISKIEKDIINQAIKKKQYEIYQ